MKFEVFLQLLLEINNILLELRNKHHIINENRHYDSHTSPIKYPDTGITLDLLEVKGDEYRVEFLMPKLRQLPETIDGLLETKHLAERTLRKAF